MGTAADFASAHRELIAVLGEPATYTPAAGGGAIAVTALLDRHTAEVGEFGQVVAYRPAVSVLCADVPRPEGGDVIAFAGSTWNVLRIASSDDMAVQLWVEAA